MEIKKVSKYFWSVMRKSLIIYYSICMLFLLLSVLFTINTKGEVTISGGEFSTVIFSFVAGIAMFKEIFHFIKANNISRKAFLIGTALSIIPISGVMSIIDIIINRLYNLFTKSPTIYDMGFTDYNIVSGMLGEVWVQQNDIITIINTFLFQMSQYLMFFALGSAIAMIYYKCNKFMKIVVSISPVMAIIMISVYMYNYPYIANKITRFMEYILGINPNNVYAPILTFIVSFVLLTGVSYLLIRKMVVKEK